MGAEATIDEVRVSRDPRVNDAAALFGESASRVVVSVSADDVTNVLEEAAARGVPARVVGQTGGNLLRIAVGGRLAVDLSVAEAERAWSTAIERRFAKRVA
jgi:phosphoribosylformylglycinamidine synthase